MKGVNDIKTNKKEHRSLYEIIFGAKSDPTQTKNQQLTSVQFLNGFNAGTYGSNYTGNIYDDITVRAIVDTVARHMSKAKMCHTLKGVVQNDYLNRLLEQPNPTMNNYDFITKIVTNLFLSNNAYVYIQFSPSGQVVALWPIEYNKAELKQDKQNNLWLSFTFNNGQHRDELVENMIVLRRNLKNDFYAENNAPLIPVLSTMENIRQSIIKAVANSAIIRGILKLIGQLQPEDRAAKKTEFETAYTNAAHGGGVVVMDGTMDYTPLTQSDSTVIDDKVTNTVRKQLFEYFGVSEAVVSGDYTEAQFQAFWESVIEPLLCQMEQEFSQKIFNTNQLAFGNAIKFQSSKIEYLSYKTRIDLVNSLKDLGVLNKGTICNLLQLPDPIDPDTVVTYVNYKSSETTTNSNTKEETDG